jgi:hypothetical protein
VTNRIFYTDAYKNIEKKTQSLLNSHDDFLSPTTASSPRAVGDAIEEILRGSFASVLGDLCDEYSAQFARRAMADMAFKDADGHYYVVDVKTHRTDTAFSMPNLTSVERLARFYADDTNYFVVMMVNYHIEATRPHVTQVMFVPIEFLDWECLTIGALGWGQIQIANANCITISPQYPRKKWMLQLCDALLEFYPREIAKIDERTRHFNAVRDYWLAKADV